MEATEARLDTTPEKAISKLESVPGMGEAEISAALGASRRSLHRWSSGQSHPQKESRARLARLVALADRLEETFGENVSDWLHADSRYLGGMKPVEALRAGRVDRVEDALEALDSGVVL